MVAALSGALLTALLLPDRTPSDGFTFGRPEATGLPREVLAADTREEGTTWQPPTTRPSGRPSALPRLLSIPRLGLRMLVLPRGVDDRGAMALPTAPPWLGWYRFGSRPLDRAGATVLAGHVDTRADGAGPLAGPRRPTRRRPHRGTGRSSDRSATCTTSVTRIRKSRIDLPAVFSRAGPPRLHLVTCGGAYLPEDGGYQDNVVVVARRLPSGS